MLNESEKDELLKLRDTKATLQTTISSLNEQLSKAEAKKKEELELLQG